MSHRNYMNYPILSIYNVVSVPGHREFYPHKHNELEIAYFRSGYGTYSVTGHDYPIEPGDIFIYSNNEIHKITYVNPSYEMSALNIHFSPRILLSQQSYSETSEEIPDLTRLFFDRREKYSNRITRETAGSSYSRIVNALLEAENEYNSTLIGNKLVAKNSLINALVYILRGCDLVSTQSSLGGSNSQIAAALEYIDTNFSQDIGISELCSVANMGRSNFERLFGKFAGITPGEYIKRRRIDHAIHLLQSTDKTILAIALEAGYHNTANFNKQFKTVTGRTPGSYRSKQ